MKKILILGFATALGVLGLSSGVSAWWQRHASHASLRTKAEDQLRHRLMITFAAIDEPSTRIQEFRIVSRSASKVRFSGVIEVDRCRFEEGSEQAGGPYIPFAPSGSVAMPFVGDVRIDYQPIAAARFLGSSRPFARVEWTEFRPVLNGHRNITSQAWDRAPADGANALFDAHFEANFDEQYAAPNGQQEVFIVIAGRVLIQEKRYQEAFDLIAPGLSVVSDDAWSKRKLVAAQEQLAALKKDGAGNQALAGRLSSLIAGLEKP